MLSNQEVCNFLNEQLNFQEESYKIKIYSEIGKNTEDGTIQGVLTRTSPKLTPIHGIVITDYNFNVELSIPAQIGNKFLENIENRVNKFAEEWNGQEYQFKNGKGAMQMNLTSTGAFKTDSLVGNSIPLTFSLSITYTKNVITSLSKHWLLDGVEIPYSHEDLMVEKEGRTNPVQDKLYKKTLLTGQTKFYHFVIPYSEGVAVTLQKDMLDGDFEKTYKLSFYDGVSYTEEEPFETIVSIFRSANANSDRPKASMLDIIFSDVDKVKTFEELNENEVVYELGLFDDDFDAQSENTRYFKSQEEQHTYYDSKVNAGAKYQTIKAPNLDSIVLTNQIYRNENNYDLFNLTNKNKAVIRVGKKTKHPEFDNQIIILYDKYFYYDVTNPVIGAKNQVSYDLRIDSVQTYYFDKSLEFDGTIIQKAHLNRWIEDGGSIVFNGKVDSKLFEREEIKEVAKRLVRREKFKYSTDVKYCAPINKSAVTWINNSVKFWVYYYIDSGDLNTSVERDGTSTTIKETFNVKATQVINNGTLGANLSYPTGCICVPFIEPEVDEDDIIYRKMAFGYKKNEGTETEEIVKIDWDFEAINLLLSMNGGYSRIKAVKISLKPPFNFSQDVLSTFTKTGKQQIGQVSFTTETLYLRTTPDFKILLGSVANQNVINLTLKIQSTSTSYGFLAYEYDSEKPIYLELDNNIAELKFSKSEVKRGTSLRLWNPKLNDMDYKTLRLTFMGSSQEFPINKLNMEKIVVKYNEMLTPEAVTKGICRLEITDDENVLNTAYSNSFNGFLFTNDLSLPYAITQYDQYMANNKNAYLSFQNSQAKYREDVNQQHIDNARRSIISNFTSALSDPKKLASAIGGIGNDALDIVSAEVMARRQLSYNQTQFDLSMDNMRNAPDTLANANGNVMFGDSVSDFGIYAEIYEGLDTELEMANDFMMREGFTYNRFDNLRAYDKVRHYFNYVRAMIGNMSGVAISNPIRNDIRQRFANGIRFWKKQGTDFKVDYSMENYEEWIDTNYDSFEEWLDNQ